MRPGWVMSDPVSKRKKKGGGEGGMERKRKEEKEGRKEIAFMSI